MGEVEFWVKMTFLFKKKKKKRKILDLKLLFKMAPNSFIFEQKSQLF